MQSVQQLSSLKQQGYLSTQNFISVQICTIAHVAWSRLQELTASPTWWRWLQWTHVKHVCISAMWKNARVVPVQFVLKICQFDIILYSIWSYMYKVLSRVAAHRNPSYSILFLAIICEFAYLVIEQIAIWTILQVMHLLFYILSNLLLKNFIANLFFAVYRKEWICTYIYILVI